MYGHKFSSFYFVPPFGSMLYYFEVEYISKFILSKNVYGQVSSSPDKELTTDHPIRCRVGDLQNAKRSEDSPLWCLAEPVDRKKPSRSVVVSPADF